MGFTQDLKNGEAIETEILNILKTKFPGIVKEEGKFCREFYDLIVPKTEANKEIKIEIKADFYVSKNFAFECLGRKSKPTGVIKTSSDYWIHFRSNKYYVWDSRKLRRYLLDVGGMIRDCGDNLASSAWIIEETRVLKECKPLGVIDRNSKELCDIIK